MVQHSSNFRCFDRHWRFSNFLRNLIEILTKFGENKERNATRFVCITFAQYCVRMNEAQFALFPKPSAIFQS